jgi:hypothetical protein
MRFRGCGQFQSWLVHEPVHGLEQYPFDGAAEFCGQSAAMLASSSLAMSSAPLRMRCSATAADRPASQRR